MDRTQLVGRRLPDGRFTIEPEAHRRWVEATFAGPWRGDVAHPLYLYLVAQGGMGLGLDDFLALIEGRLEDGVMFGQGELDWQRPLRIGATYDVATTIDRVERKHGAAAGDFDVVTCRLDVADADGPVGVSFESWVVPVGAAA